MAPITLLMITEQVKNSEKRGTNTSPLFISLLGSLLMGCELGLFLILYDVKSGLIKQLFRIIFTDVWDNRTKLVVEELVFLKK